MSFTRTTFLRTLKISTSVLIVSIIIGYAIWRSLNYARGPDITVAEPADGASISASTTVIRGTVERANKITLNGKALSIDEEGNFNETIVLFLGMNILTFEASDQFERSIKAQVRVLRK